MSESSWRLASADCRLLECERVECDLRTAHEAFPAGPTLPDGICMVRWLLSSLSLRSAMTFLSFSDHVWGSLDGRSAGLAALGTYSK